MEASRPGLEANPGGQAQPARDQPSHAELTEKEIRQVFDALGLTTEEKRAAVLASLAPWSDESERAEFVSYLDNSSEERSSE